MLIALRELRRRPGRFGVATGALALLSVLLLLLGGLLDGLYLGSTGAIRTQEADVFVYSVDARDSFLRSRIGPDLRATVERVDGVDESGGLGLVLLGARVPGESELADVAVFGYERATSRVPPPPAAGEAWADSRLRADGVEQGDTLEVGPARTPLRVTGFVDDTSFLLQGALWVDPATWRGMQGANRPDAAVSDDTFQVLTVAADGVSAALLAERIDEATGGATKTLTRSEAVLSLPGTRQQNSTFRMIILVTFLVSALVVSLFFALLTLERAPLYGVLKALGASTRNLAAGLLLQALAVTLLAFAAGALLTAALAGVIPAEVPIRFTGSRFASVAAGVGVSAAFGATASFRRLVRIDPASAIGGAA